MQFFRSKQLGKTMLPASRKLTKRKQMTKLQYSRLSVDDAVLNELWMQWISYPEYGQLTPHNRWE